jgi:hypothetical protein
VADAKEEGIVGLHQTIHLKLIQKCPSPTIHPSPTNHSVNKKTRPVKVVVAVAW